MELEFKSVFQEGSKPTLDEVLENREKRVGFLKKLFSIYPQYTIVSFKCNIPGEVKNNAVIGEIFEKGLDYISACVKNEGWESVYTKKLSLNTGPEYFEVISAQPLAVKEKVTSIEENEVLGRLFDIDVIYKRSEKLHYVERQEIGYPKRKCFVCNNNANLCGSLRAHSILEIYKSMEDIIKRDGSIKL